MEAAHVTDHTETDQQANADADRILIADATDQRRALAVQQLTQAGYVVEAVTDAADAWRSLRRAPARLVLLEVKAPDLAGLEVLTRIRSGRVAPDTPVILIVSGMRDNDVDAGISLGATEFLVKPFSARELLLRVDSVLRNTVEIRGPWDEYTARHRSAPVAAGR